VDLVFSTKSQRLGAKKETQLLEKGVQLVNALREVPIATTFIHIIKEGEHLVGLGGESNEEKGKHYLNDLPEAGTFS